MLVTGKCCLRHIKAKNCLTTERHAYQCNLFSECMSKLQVIILLLLQMNKVRAKQSYCFVWMLWEWNPGFDPWCQGISAFGKEKPFWPTCRRGINDDNRCHDYSQREYHGFVGMNQGIRFLSLVSNNVIRV